MHPADPRFDAERERKDGPAVDPKFLELIRDDPRFTCEAYEFVCEAVTFTQERLGRIAEEEDDPATEHHISGEELLRGACDLAVREYGMMARVVFRQWGIHTTDDFGEMVFKLIEAGRLSKSERDEPDDFRHLFDLNQALSDGFEMSMSDKPQRGDR
jgi:uncharacterized repeat protein (TIGR04138 family)